MNKKQIGTAILTASLLLGGLSSNAFAKSTPVKQPAAKEVGYDLSLADGRNLNGIGTAQINTVDSISGYYGFSQVVTGEVVIDGAREDLANLSITVGGKEASTIWSIAGKKSTYGFIADIDLNSHNLTSLTVHAETTFYNGVKAGMVHSNNSKSINVEVLAVVADYSLDYGTPDGKPDFVWNEETQSYSLDFTVYKKLSNGEIEKELVTLTGLTPNGKVSFTSDDLNDKNYFGNTFTLINDLSVPSLPVVDVVVTGISNVSFDLVPQGLNQFKVLATYTINYSDGSTKIVNTEPLEGGNISNPITQNQNSSTREYSVSGIAYDVTVSYMKDSETFIATAVKK